MYAHSDTSPARDFGLLLIRIILGVVLMFHGSQKLFGWFEGPGIAGFAGFLDEKLAVPMPHVAAYAAALSEFVGGLFLLVGFFTRIAAIPVVITMLVAIIKVHPNAFSGENGMEFPLTLAVVAAGLMFTGPGRLSVDYCLGARGGSPPPSDG